MTKIKITNPYYDKEMNVLESVEEIERQVEHIDLGYRECVKLHTDNGELVLLSPRNIASCEIKGGRNG